MVFLCFNYLSMLYEYTHRSFYILIHDFNITGGSFLECFIGSQLEIYMEMYSGNKIFHTMGIRKSVASEIAISVLKDFWLRDDTNLLCYPHAN